MKKNNNVPYIDLNKLSLGEMVDYLRNRYKIHSTMEAKCIYHLIEFYDNHKDISKCICSNCNTEVEPIATGYFCPVCKCDI